MNQRSNILNNLTEVDALVMKAIELIFTERESDQEAFNVTLMKLVNEFKDWLKQTYLNDSQWLKIRKSILNSNNSQFMTFSDFHLWNDLLYLIDHNEQECLIISRNLKKEVFKLSHNLLNHQGFHCVFNCLTTSMYFECNAAKHFKLYIEYCPSCQLN